MLHQSDHGGSGKHRWKIRVDHLNGVFQLHHPFADPLKPEPKTVLGQCGGRFFEFPFRRPGDTTLRSTL
jgi:hypothetical protein